MTLPQGPFFDQRVAYERAGFKWLLDTRNLIDFAIANHAGVWEPHSTEIVKRLVKPGMTCFDVGANIGYYTVLMAHLVGEKGHVVAFEPMAEARFVLREHLALNGLNARCGVMPEALGDVDVWTTEKRPYAFTMAQHPRYEGNYESVHTITLDICTATAPDEQSIDFLKIDTDGHDFQVLRGAKETIKRYNPIILIEVGDSTLRQVEKPSAAPGEMVKAIMWWLYHAGSRGYDFFYEYDLKPCLSPADLMARVDLTKYTTNLLCMPRGRVP